MTCLEAEVFLPQLPVFFFQPEGLFREGLQQAMDLRHGRCFLHLAQKVTQASHGITPTAKYMHYRREDHPPAGPSLTPSAIKGYIIMTRTENRHHHNRIILRRIRAIRDRWNTPRRVHSEEWILRQARMKTNPFTSCSCEGCQGSGEHRACTRRERKAAKLAAREEGRTA